MDYDKLTAERLGESSEAIRVRVERAWDVQRKRFAGGAIRESSLSCNADMGSTEVQDLQTR